MSNNYKCGHCGYEGPCYGIGHSGGVSAPFCKQCERNDKLEIIYTSTDTHEQIDELLQELSICSIAAPPEHPVHPKVCDKAHQAISNLRNALVLIERITWREGNTFDAASKALHDIRKLTISSYREDIQ